MINKYSFNSSMMRGIAAALIGILNGVGCSAALESQEQTAAEETPLLTIGSPAPGIDVEHWLSDGRGRFQPVTEFKPGHVYVVEFWATWCGPCISSMPHLAEVQNKYAKDNLQIISISDEDLETVQQFLKKPVRGASPTDEDDPDSVPTYAELTSAYCLTTDPDGSVQTDYMEAAGQNGIPTCFIVGKDAHIEWIGHPMAMDKPLQQIVAGSWDRNAFMVEFKKEQDRDVLMSRLQSLMRRQDTDAALKLIEAEIEKAGDDEQHRASLERMVFQIKASSAMAKISSGKQAEGIAELQELAEKADPMTKRQLQTVTFSALMQAEAWNEAAQSLSDIAQAKDQDPEVINQLTWQIYEAAKDDPQFPEVLLTAATDAVTKAVEKAPNNGMIIDTLARLLHRQGKLDQALEMQTRAVANVDNAPAEAVKELKSFLEQLQKEQSEK